MIWNELGVVVAGILTLAIFSLLYKDNPFYRFAEHLLVGVSAGYYMINYFYSGVIRKFYVPVFQQGNLWLLPGGLFGLLMLGRLLQEDAMGQSLRDRPLRRVVVRLSDSVGDSGTDPGAGRRDLAAARRGDPLGRAGRPPAPGRGLLDPDLLLLQRRAPRASWGGSPRSGSCS